MSGSADGPGPDARFFIPLDIAVDGSDNLFIADFGNNSIRKITPEGIVSTLAGGTYGYAGDSRQDGGAPRRRRPTMGAEKQSDGSLGRGDDGIAGGEGTEVA